MERIRIVARVTTPRVPHLPEDISISRRPTWLQRREERKREREREVDKTACGHSRSIGGDRCSCQLFVANHRQNDVDRCGAKSLRFRSEFSGNDSRYTYTRGKRTTFHDEISSAEFVEFYLLKVGEAA